MSLGRGRAQDRSEGEIVGRRKAPIVSRRLLELANAALTACQAARSIRLIRRPADYTLAASNPLTLTRSPASAFAVKPSGFAPGVALGFAVLAAARPALPTGITAAVSTVAFGDITANILAGTAAKTIGTITLTCSASCGTAITVGLDQGQNGGATRNLKSGSGALVEYNLYSSLTNEAANSPWGNASSDWVTAAALTKGATDVLSVYAQVYSGQQTAPVGTYSDIVNVTISF
jgi:outer membrane usher protein